MSKPVLQVIVASTRPGRIGRTIADWFADRAELHGAFTVEIVDLAAVNLPMFDEPKHPRSGEYVHQHTKDWSATISRADAFVFVMPEYNYGFNAAVKNAVDFLSAEWAHKPVSFVSYGGMSGGVRAVQMFKQVVTTLKMYPIQDAVAIASAAQFIDAERRFVATEALDTTADAVLSELLLVNSALAGLRANLVAV